MEELQDGKHQHSHHHSTSKGLKTAFWLNAFFTVFEFIGGYFANSTAIMTDAVHDLGDTIAIGTGVIMEKISKKEKNSRYTYGYRRFSILSAVLLSIFLLTGAMTMLIKSIFLLFEPKEVNSVIMLGLAVIGITVNGIGFLGISKGNKEKGHNAKAVMFHLLEDVLGWAAVLIGSIVIYFTNWNWIDPLLSILIALFIISQTIPNLIQSGKIFLQSNPKEKEMEKIKKQLLNISGVKELKSINIWTLDGVEIIGTIQIIIDSTSTNQQSILHETIKIAKSFGIDQPTIQVEKG
jgi:cobalt-zinc-cadmium efflux system protein